MIKDIDFLLSFLSDTSKIIQDDKLADYVKEDQSLELFESELDNVYAASKTDYERFTDILNKKTGK